MRRLLVPLCAWSLATAAAAQDAAQGAARPLTVSGMPDGAPLTVTASADDAALRVRVALEDGWHLYSRDVGGGQPVAIRLTGGAFAEGGKLSLPGDAEGHITGKAELVLPLRRTGAGERLQASMSFMVCDPLQCLPPIALELTSPFRVLLVAVDDSERTQRIAAFLRERGIEPTVTTYADVTAAACDAHEVVIADSLTFDQQRAKKVDATKFPKTSSPVVAIGFLGTRVLQANKIAMACGYI
jgi:DsbC/DsbD-like thiol-disulfide interchange protein